MNKLFNVIDKIAGVLCILAIIGRIINGLNFGEHPVIDVIISIIFMSIWVIMAWRLLTSHENTNGWDTAGGVLAVLLLLFTIASAVVFKNISINEIIIDIIYVYAAIRLLGKNTDNAMSAGGCLMGLLFPVIFFAISILLVRWVCDIDPEKTYHWWNGIWHGIFFPTNLILHWFKSDILFKAPVYAGGYNFFFWFSAIGTILGILGGGRGRN